jgi:diguanylate cyclase (GGDEF)-like protein
MHLNIGAVVSKLKLLITIVTVITLWAFSAYSFEKVEDIRIFNLITESFTALVAAFFFFKMDSLADKHYYKYLSLGFYFAIISLSADALDQLYYHGEIYTAIIEKTMRLLGYAFVFIGLKHWLNEYKQLNEKLSIQAFKDTLTGLYNRRGMLNQLDKMCHIARDEKIPLSIIIIDFDDFKIINDNYGNIAGDKVLERVAQSLLQFLSKDQKIGRWGGEEFAIAQLKVKSEQARELCENIRVHIKSITMPKALNNHPVTLSFGVSELRDNEIYLDVIKRADRALYKSKKAGKDCVTVL